MSRSDPTGNFACSNDMAHGQCVVFQRGQKTAIRKLEKVLPKLERLAAKLDSGEKLNRSERSLQKNIEKSFNLEKGSLGSSAAKALLGRGNNIIDALKDQFTKVAENFNSLPGDSPATRAGVEQFAGSGVRPFPNTIGLLPTFFDSDISTSERGREIAHEADHLENNGIDSAYMQSPSFLKLTPEQATNNPDSVLRALGF